MNLASSFQWNSYCELWETLDTSHAMNVLGNKLLVHCVVAYNKPNLINELLGRISDFEKDASVIIIDNSEVLILKDIIPPHMTSVFYVKNRDKTSAADGFHLAMSFYKEFVSKEEVHSYLWCHDHDGFPLQSVDGLVGGETADILCPDVYSSCDSVHWYNRNHLFTRFNIGLLIIPSILSLYQRISFVGMAGLIVSRSCIEAYGIVDCERFSNSSFDYEYSLRVYLNGGTIKRLGFAYYHPYKSSVFPHPVFSIFPSFLGWKSLF